MHPLHVVPEIPVAREAISGSTTFTTFICAEIWFVAVPVHCVSFTLMTEEAGSGRETRVLTSNNLAPIWLQMGVDKFAGAVDVVSV